DEVSVDPVEQHATAESANDRADADEPGNGRGRVTRQTIEGQDGHEVHDETAEGERQREGRHGELDEANRPEAFARRDAIQRFRPGGGAGARSKAASVDRAREAEVDERKRQYAPEGRQAQIGASPAVPVDEMTGDDGHQRRAQARAT